jgi:hypothetical protein
MAMTAKELYEMAQKLPLRERKRLVRRLLKDLERARGRKQKAGAKGTDPFADDPWFAELRQIQRRAEKALGLHTLEDIMTWLRGRPWRVEE